MLKKTRKLTLNKEKLRILVDDNLDKAKGAGVAGTNNTCDTGRWCSSGTIGKCYSNVAIHVQCYAN